ncbi:HU family DNA-binding protein [Enterococcus sulfureus]|nr:HU family DNA-binding protein [Enterococcus sulfureus]
MVTYYQNIDPIRQYYFDSLDHSKNQEKRKKTYSGGETNLMANKAELIEKVAAATDLTKKDATAAVDAVFSTIQEALANGEKVQLIGFGNFEVRTRAERKGRNPQTGEEIKIPASKVPAFKPGKALKDAVK